MISLPTDLLGRIPALLIAITFHEYAHARMAYFWGDPTAKLQGRLSLNPIAHLDPIGLLMLVIVRFGWARPVPINPFNFRDRRKGLFWVSFAGPGMNLILGFLATFFYVIFKITTYKIYGSSLYGIVGSILYNLVIYNVFLAIFNMIPLPPLDGSKILSTMLRGRNLQVYQQIEPYGPFLLILLLVFGGLGHILGPIAFFIINIYETIVSIVVTPFL
ncbi:MAG TPA: site-2 protease family protein [Firmicutes bacterium]|jgi:Zn-dependent protease|nr:site-2 protease family protein [Bacillota bacterium]